MKVKDVMASDVLTISYEARVKDVFMMIQRFIYPIIPVVRESDDFAGIVREKDIISMLYPQLETVGLSQAMVEGIPKRMEDVGEIPISDLIARDASGIYPWTPVEQAAAHMLLSRATAMPVIYQGRFVGIVTQKMIFEGICKAMLSDVDIKSKTISTMSQKKEGEGAPQGDEIVQLWNINKKEVPQDKRAHKRADFKTDVAFRLVTLASEKDKLSSEGTAVSRNISAGGLMLEFPQSVAIGLLLYVKFKLKETDNPIECLSRVCWIQPGSDGKVFVTGIAFLAISSKERGRINEYVTEQLAAAS